MSVGPARAGPDGDTIRLKSLSVRLKWLSVLSVVHHGQHVPLMATTRLLGTVACRALMSTYTLNYEND
jgi:hypothetical protein